MPRRSGGFTTTCSVGVVLETRVTLSHATVSFTGESWARAGPTVDDADGERGERAEPLPAVHGVLQ